MHTLKDKVAIRRALSPVSVADNTAQVSQIIDTQGFEGCLFAVALGSLADADVTFTVLVEHGDAANLSDAAAAPDDVLVGTEAAAGFQFDDDNEVRSIEYIGPKRYCRLTITPANNTGAALLSVLAILSGARKAPAV
jgi:hypothetical protein